MLIKILITLGILLLVFFLVAIYACFILSGRISEIERQQGKID